MLRPAAMLFALVLACSPSPRDVEGAASTSAPASVAFHFDWPDGRATVTRTWRGVGVGGEDSTLVTRWTLRATRSEGALELRSSDYEIVEFAGQVGRVQVVDGRGALGDINIDASGEIAEIAGLEALGEHVRAMERARHGDSNDVNAEFRGRVIEALAGAEQLQTVVRSSWALLVGNLDGQTLALTGEAPQRSKKTLAYGGGIVVDTLVERSVETGVPCGDLGPPACVRVRARTRPADPRAAMAALVRAMDVAAGNSEASNELADVQLVGEWNTELVCEPETLRPHVLRMHDRSGVIVGGEPTLNESDVSLSFAWGADG